MKIPPVGAELSHADGRTGRNGFFCCNFWNSPAKRWYALYSFSLMVTIHAKLVPNPSRKSHTAM